jgi:hypothetical protein
VALGKFVSPNSWVEHTQGSQFIGLPEGRLVVPEALANWLWSSDVIFLLPGGGHLLPVLHHGHLEHALEPSTGIAVSRHLCIAGDDVQPFWPVCPGTKFGDPSVLGLVW